MCFGFAQQPNGELKGVMMNVVAYNPFQHLRMKVEIGRIERWKTE